MPTLGLGIGESHEARQIRLGWIRTFTGLACSSRSQRGWSSRIPQNPSPQSLAWRDSSLSRTRSGALARRSLASWSPRGAVGLVVDRRRRLVFLPGGGVPLSRSVSAASSDRAADRNRSAILVLLQQSGRLLSLCGAMFNRLATSSGQSFESGISRFASPTAQYAAVAFCESI